MKAEEVKVEDTMRGLRITVPDDSTDSLVVVDVIHTRHTRPELITTVMMRGNYSAGRYTNLIGAYPRRAVRCSLAIEAHSVDPQAMEHRKQVVREHLR